MAQLADLTAPEVGTATGLHRHDARGQLAEKLQHLRSAYLFAQNRPSCAVGSMHLEHILRQIEPDRDNLRHDRSPLWIVVDPPWHIRCRRGAVTSSTPIKDGPNSKKKSITLIIKELRTKYSWPKDSV